MLRAVGCDTPWEWLCLLGFGGYMVGCDTPVGCVGGGCGVGFSLAAAHGLPGCPGLGCGCVWWFENSIVCTVLLAMGRIRVGVACGS